MQVRMLLCLALAALHVEGLPLLSQRDQLATTDSIHLPGAAAARAYQAEVSAADAKEVLGV
ncbi:hypothetical protein ISF_01290 [Cordyceps fumosorosea ARSEF 2679]|uniref:Uncharacterized protein n=1 Tax=Cordyceps fumosorosea (strain ARSEF 2679) TaxID=1081104 RepID=A0A168D638_CORFA|nr:hypothetical protein ISF_01290 [Cordyceps fumosorosea ARSEF 2679]OAA72217.1 hypothetical protein ISF_01290 [Cordyceps fumosorosea ARSEF 2679]